MAKRILVPIDQKTPAGALLDLVGDAVRGNSATVRLLHVAPVTDNVIGVDGHTVAYADQAAARLDAEARDRLRIVELHIGGDIDATVRFGNDPASEILAEADDFDADLIAMATNFRVGVGPLFVGGVAEQVARRASVAVAIVRCPA
jgi:nucleotide-binding universal stress UspA family protein